MTNPAFHKCQVIVTEESMAKYLNADFRQQEFKAIEDFTKSRNLALEIVHKNLLEAIRSLDVLPLDGVSDCIESLSARGISFAESYNSEFIRAKMPPGWKKVPLINMSIVDPTKLIDTMDTLVLNEEGLTQAIIYCDLQLNSTGPIGCAQITWV